MLLSLGYLEQQRQKGSHVDFVYSRPTLATSAAVACDDEKGERSPSAPHICVFSLLISRLAPMRPLAIVPLVEDTPPPLVEDVLPPLQA
jgi:hypothetical protein